MAVIIRQIITYRNIWSLLSLISKFEKYNPKNTYTMASLESAYFAIEKLVNDFKNNEKHYLNPEYSESQARIDFIDKFFIALGWDVNHDEQKNPYEQEVKVERKVTVSAAQKRADYAFFLKPNFRDPKFYVEAKKPSRSLTNSDDYFQAIRYGWNAQTPLVVLTDFEEFHIIDSRYKPNIKSALDRKVKSFHYSDYLDKDKFNEIYFLFSRESVENNSLEKFAETLPKPRGKAVQKGLFAVNIQSIDESFLEELDGIRNTLAKIFKKTNPNLGNEELTEATQRVIDRLVFIRFLEDKLIEGEHHISEYGDKNSAWKDFVNDCKVLNAKYNGIVFKTHSLIDSLNMPDDKEFGGICEELSHVNSPYNFDAIPIHILGSIYERFLGKVVHVTGKRVTIEEKPEVRKAGGVYYTPQYIVQYIVDNTIGKLIENKSPKEISKLRFADISCGSGSFLITAYDTLLRYHSKWYQLHEKEAKEDGCHFTGGLWVLSLKQKREILLNNIYGVDIDYQATEVTQLSLYLKLLEDESQGTADEMQVLFKEKILPDLSKNIICGNSLIGTDITDSSMFPTDEQRKINAMNFEDAFPAIMKNGGFDTIVGNPPYINIQFIENINKDYLRRKYKVYGGKADLLYFFFEKSIRILKQKGFLGYITSRYFLEATDATPLREFIMGNSGVIEFTDFTNKYVFKNVGIHSVISLIMKNIFPTTRIRKFKTQNKEPLTSNENFDIFTIKLENSFWLFTTENEKNIVDKLNDCSVTLGTLSIIEQGQKSGLNSVFGINFELAKKLEKEPLKKLVKNSHIKRYDIEFKNVYLIYADSSFDIEKYPKIKAYLEIHKKELKDRAEAKDNIYPWYRLQRPRDKSLFNSKEKLIVPYRAEFNKFAYDDQQYYNDGGDIRIIVMNGNSNYSIKYCLGILNSRLINFYYQFIGRRKGKMLEYFVEPLNRIPIKSIDFTDKFEKSQHDKMVFLVGNMLDCKKLFQEAKTEKDKSYYENMCSTIDRQIDQLVYEIYGLTEEEIRIVESG